MLGFNDTYGIAIRKELARKYKIKTYSDLQKLSRKLVFGAEYEQRDRKSVV